MVRKWKRILQTDASSNSLMDFDVNSPTYTMLSDTAHSHTPGMHYLISSSLHLPASFRSTHTHAHPIENKYPNILSDSSCITLLRTLIPSQSLNMGSVPFSLYCTYQSAEKTHCLSEIKTQSTYNKQLEAQLITWSNQIRATSIGLC